MNNTLARIFDPSTIWVHVGALLAIAAGLADLWHFRSLPATTALLMVGGGFSAFGITAAAAWPSPPAPPTTPTPPAP